MTMTHRQALLSIHVSAVLFGLTGIFGELIQADAVAITAGRAGFACLALYAFMRLQGQHAMRGVGMRQLTTLLAAAVMLAVHWITFFIAVKVGGVAIATLGFASFPAFITLFERFVLKDAVSTAEWIILGLVTFGLLLVTPSFDFRDQATIGLGWAVLSGLTFSLFTLINRRAARELSAQQAAYWENLFVLLLTLPFAGSALLHIDALNLFWIFLLGVFCTGLSHYLMVASLGVLNARSAGIVIALEPVYAIAFAAVLFAQYPSARALIGGAIMIGAIIWSGLRKASAPSRPADTTAT